MDAGADQTELAPISLILPASLWETSGETGKVRLDPLYELASRGMFEVGVSTRGRAGGVTKWVYLCIYIYIYRQRDTNIYMYMFRFVFLFSSSEVPR